MAILRNTNTHAVRMTLKIDRNVHVWNIPSQGEIEVPGNGLGAPTGVVVVKPKAAKKPAAKKVKAEKPAEKPAKESKTDK